MFKYIIGKIKYFSNKKIKYKTGDKMLNILPGDFNGGSIYNIKIKKIDTIWFKK